jgi:class 3 adenylate cyclase
MKHLSTLLFCILCVSLSGQSDKIKELEKTMPAKTGENYISAALQLSEFYHAEAFFEKSEHWAGMAYETARLMKRNADMASALNHQGKALLGSGSKRNKNKAFKDFEESNKLTSDKALRVDNLEQMNAIAIELGKKKDLDDIRKELAILKGEQEMKVLEEKVSTLSEKQEQLMMQQHTLESLVNKKEAAIKNMSAEQAKRELLLSEQERLLDSLAFSSIIDSMEISQQELQLMHKEAELKEAAAEIQLRKSQRNLLLAIAGFVILLAIGLFNRYFVIRQHNAVLAEKNLIIEKERKRSEELLLNILPVAVADELKAHGFANVQQYDQASVLFTDFKGFSEIAKILPAEKLVNNLDYAFKNFDRIIGKHGLEKIKTIGDAYMCAGGLPTVDGGHPVEVVRAALEIQEFLREWNREKLKKGDPPFEARIGIHTGPLVAGVVGSKKFAYDIWGDTVNVAARMETNSEPGRVNISSSTFHFVKHEFDCEYRGKVPAKNVGEVEMYFVKDERTNGA